MAIYHGDGTKQYRVVFLDRNRITSLFVKGVSEDINEEQAQFALSKMKKKNPGEAEWKEDEIVVAYLLLQEHANANNIDVSPQEKQAGNSNGKGLGILFLLVLAFIVAVLLAPVIVALGVHGKFLMKDLFKNVKDMPAFKRFIKKYLLGGYIFMGVCVVLLILFGILSGAGVMATEGTSAILGVWFGGDIAYVVVCLFIGNKIYKAHKDDPLPVETEEAPKVEEAPALAASSEGPVKEQPEEVNATPAIETEEQAEPSKDGKAKAALAGVSALLKRKPKAAKGEDPKAEEEAKPEESTVAEKQPEMVEREKAEREEPKQEPAKTFPEKADNGPIDFESLKKLKELLDMGAITKKEFEREKAKLLQQPEMEPQKEERAPSQYKKRHVWLWVLAGIFLVVGVALLALVPLPFAISLSFLGTGGVLLIVAIIFLVLAIKGCKEERGPRGHIVSSALATATLVAGIAFYTVGGIKTDWTAITPNPFNPGGTQTSSSAASSATSKQESSIASSGASEPSSSTQSSSASSSQSSATSSKASSSQSSATSSSKATSSSSATSSFVPTGPYGPDGASYSSWYVVGSGKSFSGWWAGIRLQMYKYPKDASVKAVLYYVQMEAGDVFKITDGVTWYGGDVLFDPDGCFENVPGDNNNIRCKYTGYYSVILTEFVNLSVY